MAARIIVTRMRRQGEAIYGVLAVENKGVASYVCRTIENALMAFPAGKYPIQFEHSPAFKRSLWELKNIRGRSEIKIHVANRREQLRGCIGVGQTHQDIDLDGDIDVAQSAAALEGLHQAMGSLMISTITVVEAYD